MVELIKDASNSIFTKKSHKEGFLKSGHILEVITLKFIVYKRLEYKTHSLRVEVTI